MVSRREVIVKSADEYRMASKKDKGQILDRITEITGYNRDYASHLLTLFGKRIYLEPKRGTRFILEAVRDRARVWTMEALKTIRSRLPFPLCGIDSDNDSAFINHHLQKYCEDERITFTRSRAGNKNDNCYVEQKNWSVARRVAGYARYDTEGEVKALNDLLDVYRLYVNFFLPSAKLISKTKTGAKVKKSYGTPQTPCQRLLDSDHVAEEVKSNLRGQSDSLNPADLKKEIDRLKSRLNRAFRNKNRTLAGNEIDSGKVA